MRVRSAPPCGCVGVQDAIQKVLDRTGLGPLIPTYPDRAAALAGG